MAPMSTEEQTITVQGVGTDGGHVTRLAIFPDGETVHLEIEITGPEHAWSASTDVPAPRWAKLVEALRAIGARNQGGGVPMFEGAGRVAVALGDLKFEAEGGTTQLARIVADLVLQLVAEIGGPTAPALKPEHGLDGAFGGADDTVDDSALRADLHDTIPDAMFRGPSKKDPQ